MNTGRWFNGLFFIIVGFLLLLMNYGYLSWSFWWHIGRLWPVLLIALGLKLVFGRSGAATALVLLAVLGVLGYAAWQGRSPAGSGDWETADFSQALNPAITKASLDLNFGAGELNLTGSSETLAAGKLDYFSVKPIWKYFESGDHASLNVAQDGHFPVDFGARPRNKVYQWSLTLSDQTVWDIEANTGACQAVLDLAAVPVEKIEVKTGASEVDLRLGDKLPRCAVTVKAGASSINLAFPAGSGVRLQYSSALSGNNLAQAGFIRQDEYHITPGYDNAGTKFEAEVSSGVGSLNVNFY